MKNMKFNQRCTTFPFNKIEICWFQHNHFCLIIFSTYSSHNNFSILSLSTKISKSFQWTITSTKNTYRLQDETLLNGALGCSFVLDCDWSSTATANGIRTLAICCWEWERANTHYYIKRMEHIISKTRHSQTKHSQMLSSTSLGPPIQPYTLYTPSKHIVNSWLQIHRPFSTRIRIILYKIGIFRV